MKSSFTLFRCKIYFLADDKCANAPFLKQSECSGSKCKERLKSKWQRIKCLPFSTSGRKGLCSKWCHGGGTSTQPCYDAFPSEPIYSKIGDENLKFGVVHCRSFEFIIRLERVLPSKYFPFLFLSDPFYLIFFLLSFFFLLLLLYYCYCHHYNKGIERPEVTIQPPINLTINDAKEQFRTSIQSIWSNNSRGDTNSTQDQKLEDTVFAAFIFEYFILSIARERLHVTNPEFIDVDEDLSKCKIAFPLFFFRK